MHVGFGNVLDDNGDVEVPSPHCLVVRCCYKAPVFVDKGDRIHGTQMLVVLLGDFRGVHVILNWIFSS